MQGQDRSSGSWDRPPSSRIASLNGTGKHRPVPQRPPGMVRVDQPPSTPRVSRPLRQPPSPEAVRRRILIIGSLFLVCALLACLGGVLLTNFLNGLNASSGAAATTSDFLSSLSNRDYTEAYKDLGAAITLQMSQEDFTRRAQNDDLCYGAVTGYTEVPDSATSQGNTQSYSYSITRSKLGKPYQLRLTLQQDQYTNSWKIMDYGNDLGPGQSVACKK